MTLLELPTELILLIALSLLERALAHLIQVHRSLYKLLLRNLHQRHLRDNRLQEVLFWCTATGNEAAVKNFLHLWGRRERLHGNNFNSSCKNTFPAVV